MTHSNTNLPAIGILMRPVEDLVDKNITGHPLDSFQLPMGARVSPLVPKGLINIFVMPPIDPTAYQEFYAPLDRFLQKANRVMSKK
mgnify:CR=1 FL=1